MAVFPDSNPYYRSCDEIWEGREGTAFSIDGSRPHTRLFKVVVKLKEMSEIAACACPGVPLPGSLYIIRPPGGVGVIEYDTQAILTRISGKQQEKDDWQIWIVTCEYTTVLPPGSRSDNFGGPGGVGGSSTDPSQNLADISWDFETVQETRQRDLNGNPYTPFYVNMPFTPAPHFEVDYPVLNISRNELTYNFQTASKYNRALNSKPFLGAPKGCVQCVQPKSTQQNQGNFRYWRATYKFRFRHPQNDGSYILPKINVFLPETKKNLQGRWPYRTYKDKIDMVDSWQPLICNMAQYRMSRGPPEDISAPKGHPTPIFKNGHIITYPVFLNEFGQESVPTNPADPTTAPIWWKQFINYRYLDISALLVKGLT